MAALAAPAPARVAVPAVAERFRVPRETAVFRLVATSFRVAWRCWCGLRCRQPASPAAWWVPQPRAQAWRQPSLQVALRPAKTPLFPTTRK
ncbi:MAG TPA: hypothetical protein VK504_17110 [Vicinamibacterales bacterium]|nr:hypothetical protein [Vicinamibacterales bacterium]